VIVPLVCGIGMGLAAVLGLRARAHRHPPLHVALDRLSRPSVGSRAIGLPASGDAMRDRVAHLAVRTAETLGYHFEGSTCDLAVVEKPLERHVLDKLVLAWTGLALPALLAVLCTVAGVAVPVVAVILAAVAFAAAGFFAPDLMLRRAVELRRRELRAALSSYLELVVITLAGGAGTETALFEAATVGTGQARATIRGALEACRYSGTTPWVAFAQLGERVGVEEFRELAAAASLAGEHGAPVRDSLVAKAASMHEHQLADAESDAESATERMTIPLMMLLAGFVGFLGYPAFMRVLQL
jgi:Flp pilus assembly protein TadB